MLEAFIPISSLPTHHGVLGLVAVVEGVLVGKIYAALESGSSGSAHGCLSWLSWAFGWPQSPQALVTDMFHFSEGGESCPRSPLRASRCKSLNLAEVSIQGGEVGVLCEHPLPRTYKKHL